MQLTASQVRYLLAIADLSQKKTPVSSSDIADKLQVTRPSVNKMLSVLSEKKLLEKRRYGTVNLTALGVEISGDCGKRVSLLSDKLAGALGFAPDDSKRCSIILVSEMPDLAL